MIKPKQKLVEDTLDASIKQAQSGKNVVVSSNESQGTLEKLLDKLLKINLEAHYTGDHNFVNLLVVGVGGTGKTSRIRAWASKNNLNLYTKPTSIMDDTDLKGLPVQNPEKGTANWLATTEFDELEKPDSILFLDEFNRGRASVRGTLLSLIQEHIVPDPRAKGGMRYLPNLLFTIASINPAGTDYNTEPLDDAEMSRFVIYTEEGNEVQVYLNYILDMLNRRKQNLLNNPIKNDSRFNSEQAILALDRRMALIKFLCNDYRFTFDGVADIKKSHDAYDEGRGNGLILSFRTLTNALLASDGTKEDFLDVYRMAANDQKYSLISQILDNYKDVDDKANKALKNHKTKDPILKDTKVFAKRSVKNDLQSFKDVLDNL